MNKWEMDPYSGRIATWSTNVEEAERRTIE